MSVNSLKTCQKLIFFALVIVLCWQAIENFYNTNTDTTSSHDHKLKEDVPKVEYVGNQAKHVLKDDNAITTVDDSQMTEAEAILLWWTPFIDELQYTKNCGDSVCFFTGNRKYIEHDKLKTLLFYGTNIDKANMPVPRSSNHIWALLHEEAPKNVPFLLYQPALSLFNLTATFSENSDFPLTLQYLESYEQLIDRKYFIDVAEKNRLQSDENLAPVLYIQSICDTLSGRDEYVAELMKYMRIDSFGKCLNNNKNFPKSLSGEDYLSTIDTEEFYKFIARYKFVIAYENSVCDDYITEKLWRPLTLGIVPIYFGAPNVEKWLPNNESIVQINRFKRPQQLADHLLLLNNIDSKYNRLLEHKIQQKVSNDILRKALRKRNYETNSIVEDFECFICQQSVKHLNASAGSVQRKPSHDVCNENLVYPRMLSPIKERNKWQSIIKQGKCEANLFSDLMVKNEVFTKDEFQQKLMQKYDSHVCELFIPT